MSDILKLEVKDESLSTIIKNNPFYIDIKGSVNICLIKCGQEIDKCNDINFSTMTNYGKILVLNPNTAKPSKCNIKLAFDTTNDNTGDNGMSQYIFKKAFVTVPSLHRLNGQIYDMETFLIFSSTQKNGNILYICLSILSSATSIVQNNDWKLLNFKLMDELFIKNNKVPDIYGTSSINGTPNPIDLNNFIPQEGFRNFYDYTHPDNTNVNIRVFQTPMSVSNEVISTLKSKLTPGTIYENFKSSISKAINPSDNLFFYFSQDLTNNYKSYAVNNDKNKEKFDADKISELIIEEQEKYETDQSLKKLETSKNSVIEEEETKDDFDEKDNKKVEKFNNDVTKMDNSFYINIIFSVCFVLLYNYINTYFITSFFTPKKGLSEDELKNFMSEINDIDISNLLSIKFGMNANLTILSLFTFIVIVLCISYISNISKYTNKKTLYWVIFSFIIIIIIISGNIIGYNFYYFANRLKLLYDDDFSQKEKYFFDTISDKIFNSKNINIGNILKYGLATAIPFLKSTDFSKFIVNENPLNNIKNNNEFNKNLIAQIGGNNNINVVPGQIINDNPNYTDENIIFKNKMKSNPVEDSTLNKLFGNINPITIYGFLYSNLPFIYDKFKNNKSWNYNLMYYIIFYIVVFFILLSLIIKLIYDNINSNLNNRSYIEIMNGVMLILFFMVYLPIYYISSIFVYLIFRADRKFLILFLMICMSCLIIFSIGLLVYNNNAYIVTSTVLLFIFIFLPILLYFNTTSSILNDIKSKLKGSSINGLSNSETTPFLVSSLFSGIGIGGIPGNPYLATIPVSSTNPLISTTDDSNIYITSEQRLREKLNQAEEKIHLLEQNLDLSRHSVILPNNNIDSNTFNKYALKQKLSETEEKLRLLEQSKDESSTILSISNNDIKSKTILELRTKLSDSNSKIIELKTLIDDFNMLNPNSVLDINLLRTKLKNEENKIIELTKYIEKINVKSINNQVLIAQYKEKISNCENKIIILNTLATKSETNKVKNNNIILELQNKIKDYENKIKLLEEKEKEGDKYIEIINNQKEELEQYKKRINILETKSNNNNKTINKLKQIIIEQKYNLDETKNKLSTLIHDYNIDHAKLEVTKLLLNKFEIYIDIIQNYLNISSKENLLQKLENFNRNGIIEELEKYNIQKDKINDIVTNLGNIHNSINKIINKIYDINTI
jgi:uncharacterized coiled-coil protein SlyX